MRDIEIHECDLDSDTAQTFFAAQKGVYYPMNCQRFLTTRPIPRDSLKGRFVQACEVWNDCDVQSFAQQNKLSLQCAAPLSDDRYVLSVLHVVATNPHFAHIKRVLLFLPDVQVCFIRNARVGRHYVHTIPRESQLRRGEYVVHIESVYTDDQLKAA